MTYLTESATWDSVYEIATTDAVLGGDSGPANTPLQNLTNRTAYLKAQIAAILAGTGTTPYAPILSPTLTGSPKAPTQAAGDNTTLIATDEFVWRAVGGVLSKNVAGGSGVTLTAAEVGNAVLEFSGVLTANISVIVPTSPARAWVVRNKTTGSYTLTIKTLSGTGIAVAQGSARGVYSDGTNVVSCWSDWTDVLAAVPSATTTTAGLARLATVAEAAAGTSASIAVTPAGLAAAISTGVSGVGSASTTASGVVRLATTDETKSGTSASIAVTPAGLAAELLAQTQASESAVGIVQLATPSQAKAGTSTTIAVHPAGLAAAIAGQTQASESAVGIVQLATATQAKAGTSTSLAVHPAGLAAALLSQTAASESAPGIVQLATAAQAKAGVSTTIAVHPAGLAAAIAGQTQASESAVGVVQLATAAQAKAGTSTSLAVHPAGLAAALGSFLTSAAAAAEFDAIGAATSAISSHVSSYHAVLSNSVYQETTDTNGWMYADESWYGKVVVCKFASSNYGSSYFILPATHPRGWYCDIYCGQDNIIVRETASGSNVSGFAAGGYYRLLYTTDTTYLLFQLNPSSS